MPRGFSERERAAIRANPLAAARERIAAVGMQKTGIEELARAAHIPKGALVFASLLAANHDERRFAQPELLDLAREDNRHLALGQGMHYCLGAPLARMEASIAVNTLLERMPGMRLAAAPGQLRWRRSQNIRGLQALPVTV